MNRWLKLLCLITLLGILAGCWDYSPIERAFLVEGISIDESKRDPEKLEISIIDVDFKRKKRALSAEGRTISEALDRIQDQTSKIVVLSHVKIILISETIAQKSVLPYFDVFVRNMQISNEASFVIVKGRALSLFNPKNLTYSISGRTYSQMIQSSETKFDNTLYKLHNITVEMMYRNNNFTLPVLKLDKKKKVASFHGIALIKSGKMIDILSMNEAKIFLVLRRATNRMAYTIKMNNHHTITYRLYEKSSSVSCKYRNGKWHLTFRAAFNREVVESNVWKTRPMTSAERAQFEQKVTKKLEREGKKLLTKLQKEAGFDPLWVSECARMNKPNHFQSSEWDEYFTNADTNVQIQVHLHRFGQLF